MTDRIRLHRFNNYVAVSTGSGETEYLSVRQAAELAQALTVFAGDILQHKFIDSDLNEIIIEGE